MLENVNVYCTQEGQMIYKLDQIKKYVFMQEEE